MAILCAAPPSKTSVGAPAPELSRVLINSAYFGRSQNLTSLGPLCAQADIAVCTGIEPSQRVAIRADHVP